VGFFSPVWKNWLNWRGWLFQTLDALMLTNLVYHKVWLLHSLQAFQAFQ
jgi:hypothetical protein